MTDKDRRLIDITIDLGINHEVNKTAKKDLESSRGEFFDAATKTLEEGILAKRTVEVPTSTGGKRDIVETWVTKWHPGWRVIAIEENDDEYVAQIEEDPRLKKFVFVNQEDGKVYQRNAIQSDPSLDDDQLKLDDPELWLRISRPIDPPGFDILGQFCEFMEITYPTMMGWVETMQAGSDWPRVLLSMDEISDNDFSRIQEYLVPAPISLRLESPRAAKPEELVDDEI